MRTPVWLREPLVHFLIGGAVLFALFAWRGTDADPADRTIRVDGTQQAELALQFERTLKRPPTDAELDVLIAQFIREEVLYREALALGLDRGDAVVRRRLVQKMDQIAAAEAQMAQADDAVLQDWLRDHPERFAADATVSFRQVWFAKRGDAEAARMRLSAGDDVADIGERISLPATTTNMPRREVIERFGRQFARGLEDMPPGASWAGPLPSGFGFHLVQVTDRRTGTVPPLADIRDRVEDDWRNATIAARRDRAFTLLKDAYTIDLDR